MPLRDLQMVKCYPHIYGDHLFGKQAADVTWFDRVCVNEALISCEETGFTPTVGRQASCFYYIVSIFDVCYF